jgi:hypothetical protein
MHNQSLSRLKSMYSIYTTQSSGRTELHLLLGVTVVDKAYLQNAGHGALLIAQGARIHSKKATPISATAD